MNEDPLMVLLKKHFAKVNKCLENDRNFDILTRCSFNPSSDKAVDSTDFRVSNDNSNPEMENTQRKPVKNFDFCAKRPSNLKMEGNNSEVLQDEINCQENFECNQKDKPKYSKSDSANSMKQNSVIGGKGDQQKSSSAKVFKKSTMERPETPCLEMYKDEEDTPTPKPKTNEITQKMVHASPKFNWAESKEKLENLMDGKGLDLTPKVEKIAQILSDATLEETEIEFKNELEQYKKDVKLENAIRSFAIDDSVPYRPTESTNEANWGKTSKSNEQLTKGNSSQCQMGQKFESPVIKNMKIINRPRLIDDILEDAKTNVCQRASDVKSSPNFLNATESGLLQGRNIDDEDMFDSFFEKYLKNQMLINAGIIDMPEDANLRAFSGENVKQSVAETNFGTRNYIVMNHFEIQKEMSKRIEDMYKPGDGN